MTVATLTNWRHEVRRDEWRALAAAHLGWLLDAMDAMLYSFALSAIRSEFNLTSSMAGALAAAPLVTSAIGGALFGYLADRFGRVRTMAWSIFTFSVLTGITAMARTVPELFVCRALSGIGLGGQWAVGSVLVAETWQPKHRAKGIGLMQSGWALGYMAAAVLSGIILPTWGWRVLFAVGAAPAVFAWTVTRGVKETREGAGARSRSSSGAFLARLKSGPDTKALKAGPLSKKGPVDTSVDAAGTSACATGYGRLMVLFTALSCVLLFGYWGVFTWLPAYLSTPIERGGAGLSALKSSTWIIPIQVGAFLGYTTFGFIADAIGRRRAFLIFVLTNAALVPVYGLAGRNAAVLIALGPLLGFFGHGYYSVLGVIMAELFPAAIRATAQGFCYNTGRALSAAAPVTIGALSDRFGIGTALGFTSIFFAIGAALMLLLPETRATELK